MTSIRQQLEASLATLKRTVNEHREDIEPQIVYRVIVDNEIVGGAENYDNMLIWLGQKHLFIKSIGTWAQPQIISVQSDIRIEIVSRATKQVLTLPDLFKLCEKS